MIDFILGFIFGLSVYLFIRITIVSKKLDRLIRDINDTQNWIRKIQIDICDINKQWEVKRDRDINLKQIIFEEGFESNTNDDL